MKIHIVLLQLHISLVDNFLYFEETHQILTTGGTANGAACHFPFTVSYNGAQKYK